MSTINLPANTEYIGSGAFYGCSALTRIDIPSTVEIIGTEAFLNCTGLTGVYISDLAKWCGMKFGNYQYQGSNWQPTDKISNPLYYAHNLYLNNQLIVDLTIPTGVETIEQFVFQGANCIESVVFPNTVTTLSKGAFWYCTNLNAITIPSSVTSMGNNVFGVAKNIKVYVDNTETWLKNNFGLGFNNLSVSIELYAGGVRVNDLVTPTEVTSIGDYALTRLLLNSVTLHKDVESIHFRSLYNTNVKTLICQSKFAPELSGGSSFQNVKKLSAIYVPVGKGTAYKNKWTNHEAIIKEADVAMTGTQTSENISEMKFAYSAINGSPVVFMDLSGATLDESVTAETLKEGDESGNVLYYLPTESEITGDNIIKNNVAASVSLTMGEPVFVPHDFTATSLSYSCSLTKGKAATLCLPYNCAVPSGMKVYSLSDTDDEGLPVFAAANNIVANEAFLVVPSSPLATIDDADVDVVATPDEMPDGGNNDFEFRGTLTEISNADAAAMGAYVLGDDRTWHKVTTGDPTVTIPAGSAYLVPKADKGASFGTVLDIPTPITFADAEVKRICVENWDTDGDGELSYAEAAAVTDLGTVFQYNWDINSFDELRYFTGITTLSANFVGCGYMVSITLPASLVRLEGNTFFACSKLETIEIPAGVTYISGSAFYTTSNLSSIVVDENNAVFDSREHCNAIINTATNELIRACNTTVIPSSVTTIGSSAYKYMNFFTEVTIPATVQTIKAGAFQENSNLTSVTVESMTPIEIDQNTFSNRANATLHVPYGAKAAYEVATGWKEFKEIVEEIPESISVTMATASGSAREAVGYSSAYGLDFTDVEHVSAWIASGYTSSGVVLMSRVKIAPPSTGLYLTTDEPGVTVEVPVTDKSVYYANLLLPIVNRTTISPTETIDGVDYSFFAVGTLNGRPSFAPFTSTQNYGPNKCVLRVPTQYVPAASRVAGFDVEFLDDEPTTIRNIEKPIGSDDADFYDLQGRKVSVLKKGIYVRGGKKIVIRK
ncbi:MAG: leucine-rich repeat domain-containing protein [Prevotella sp.]|nr:leucine-rich repeat domain-containing protein [Prevotella sp.]